ncbi:PREDICTED: CDK2-associated and cullin domain-containing protein 1 [Pygoscelis adeliae]|nr:PREDICTED: CDK2-associated and cullin domain-containing protein 1 [Pygoscelis adeliae]
MRTGTAVSQTLQRDLDGQPEFQPVLLREQCQTSRFALLLFQIMGVHGKKKGLFGFIANVREVLASLVRLAAFPGDASKAAVTDHVTSGKRPVLCTTFTIARKERRLERPFQGTEEKGVMNVITIEDYKSTYWPKLDSAIDQLLTQSPGDYIPISYEQIYSCVYKCVCQQHSEQMYSDLIKKITNHLERVSKELQASPPDLYIERFNVALGQYMGALQSIVPLFIYMNKFYIETKLNRDLKDDLIKLFTEHVAEKHIYNLMPLLLEAQSTPFQITPSTMANIVKGLYTLRPEWVQMAPALFSKFIPNILPPAVESELQEYAAQDQKLQRELMQNGFTRGDQSRKRAGEELTYNGSSACASSRGYR